MPQRSPVEQYELNFPKVCRAFERIRRAGDCDVGGQLYRITVNACGDGGKRNRSQLQLIGNAYGFAMTTSQCFRFVPVTAAPYRADRVDHVLSR